MNNDNRRDQKPDGSPVKLVIAVIVALLVLSDAVGIGGGTVLFIVLMIGAVVLAVIAMKKRRQMPRIKTPSPMLRSRPAQSLQSASSSRSTLTCRNLSARARASASV